MSQYRPQWLLPLLVVILALGVLATDDDVWRALYSNSSLSSNRKLLSATTRDHHATLARDRTPIIIARAVVVLEQVLP